MECTGEARERGTGVRATAHVETVPRIGWKVGQAGCEGPTADRGRGVEAAAIA